MDILKAYDTVSWSFLESILGEFGFHPVMIKWIMVCLTSAHFSICINGETHGFFKAGRGLRQGDPISPYLFTLVMEVLNLMIKRQVIAEKKFQYHGGCKELKITSLFFADDILLMCHGDLISASVLRRGLDEFGMSSGLYPSMGKCEAFFSKNMTCDEISSIKMVMPFREGNLPIRYLGVPLVSKGLKINDCKVLIDIVDKRIGNWRSKSLSLAGRLQLISSVLASIQVYWPSLFMLPSSVCEQIDKRFKRFLWNRGDNAQGKASVAWKDVCKPKSQGGLGIKSVQLWNKALMVKHL